MSGHVLWFTGLSSSGKSTISSQIKSICPAYILLDGDIIRKGLCSDLGFSIEDRKENMRRLIEVCKILVINNLNVITAFISPFDEYRRRAKEEIIKIGGKLFIIWCKCSLDECMKRDPKGLYRKALRNEIKNFTGISSPYEPPRKPFMPADLILDTEKDDVYTCVSKVIDFLERRG